MIERSKLIKEVSKKAGISLAKATKAYDTILKQSPVWRSQSTTKLETINQKAVAVPGKQKIKTVKVAQQKAVVAYKTVEKLKKVEVKKNVPAVSYTHLTLPTIYSV